MNNERLYTINTLPSHEIYAGKTKNDKQILVVDSQEQEMLVAILFNLIGELENILKISYSPEVKSLSLPEKNKLLKAIRSQILIENALEELSFIRVKKFWVAGHFIGIMDYPLSLHYLLDKSEFAPNELNFLPEKLQRQLANNLLKKRSEKEIEDDKKFFSDFNRAENYVLWAGREGDYWADDSGIHST